MIKIIYINFCKIYNYIFSFYEFVFLKNRKTFNEKDYYLLTLKKKIKLDLKSKKKIFLNTHLQKYILKQQDIDFLINELFIKNSLKKKISMITGYNFFIGYVIAYKTKKILKKNINSDLFANKWHKDKPYTKNLLKIILPLESIGNLDGGIEIKHNVNQYYKMIGNSKNLLIFFPSRNYHRAGNPQKDRNQIMIQLVPSKNWSFNKNLKDDQYKIEPKFPFFSYIFKEKINL